MRQGCTCHNSRDIFESLPYEDLVPMRSRTFLISLAGFGCYFGLLLITPKAFPAFGASTTHFLLILSSMVLMPLLAITAIWAIGALITAKLDKHAMGPAARTAGRVSLAGVAAFFICIALASILPNTLPTGSYDSPFNRALWLDPGFATDPPGQATPRQKMLAAVIAQLPHKSRSEIETMLGPSMNTPYFQSTGRDLIYATGPQRDSVFGLDSEWLLIWLDEHGTYKRHTIATD